MPANNSRLERIMPLVGATILGGLLGALGTAPFVQLADGARSTMALFAELQQQRPEILGPIVYEGEGVVTRDPAAMQPGNTLVQGIMPGGAQIRLLSPDGSELHRWNADFFAIWPDADEVFSAVAVPKSENHYFIQGMSPLPDGSIVLNFGNLGAVRLDACSNLMWRSDRPTHHSVTPTAEGNFWIPGVIDADATDPAYLPTEVTATDIETMLADSTSKAYNNSVVLFAPDGRVLKEFSVLEAVYDAGLEHAIYASMQEVLADPLHVNDIELVTPALAARIDGVVPGDLLISIREMQMLAILDQEDGRLKWHQQGPFLRQHDPDITPEGFIELFNNRSQTIRPGIETSQVMRIDPATGAAQVMAPLGRADRFFSNIMGAHETQPNGNRLIAETMAGRVFEVTPTGEIVWDLRMTYDSESAALLTNATRLPTDYFDAGSLRCPA